MAHLGKPAVAVDLGHDAVKGLFSLCLDAGADVPWEEVGVAIERCYDCCCTRCVANGCVCERGALRAAAAVRERRTCLGVMLQHVVGKKRIVLIYQQNNRERARASTHVKLVKQRGKDLVQRVDDRVGHVPNVPSDVADQCWRAEL